MEKYSYGVTAWGPTPLTYLFMAFLSWLQAPFVIIAALFTGTPQS